MTVPKIRIFKLWHTWWNRHPFLHLRKMFKRSEDEISPIKHTRRLWMLRKPWSTTMTMCLQVSVLQICCVSQWRTSESLGTTFDSRSFWWATDLIFFFFVRIVSLEISSRKPLTTIHLTDFWPVVLTKIIFDVSHHVKNFHITWNTQQPSQPPVTSSISFSCSCCRSRDVMIVIKHYYPYGKYKLDVRKLYDTVKNMLLKFSQIDVRNSHIIKKLFPCNTVLMENVICQTFTLPVTFLNRKTSTSSQCFFNVCVVFILFHDETSTTTSKEWLMKGEWKQNIDRPKNLRAHLHSFVLSEEDDNLNGDQMSNMYRNCNVTTSVFDQLQSVTTLSLIQMTDQNWMSTKITWMLLSCFAGPLCLLTSCQMQLTLVGLHFTTPIGDPSLDPRLKSYENICCSACPFNTCIMSNYLLPSDLHIRYISTDHKR